MFTSKETIAERLKQCKDREALKNLCFLVTKPIMDNLDFKVVYQAKRWGADAQKMFANPVNTCMAGELAREKDGTPITVNFPVSDMLDEDSLRIYRELMQNDVDDMEPDAIRDLMAQALSNRVLFEGLCLTLDAGSEKSEDYIHRLCTDAGAEESYEELAKDPVYQARKAYSETIYRYTKAAVNLYGVVSLTEIKEIIWNYEHRYMEYLDLVRPGGPYEHTVMYSPRYFCRVVIQNFIYQSMNDEIVLTEDGYVVHNCFRNEVEKEQAGYNRYAAILAEDRGVDTIRLSDDEVSEYFASVSDCSFRRLKNEAGKTTRYLPEKREDMLAYADDSYCEITNDDRRFMRYIRNSYGTELRRWAKGQKNPETGEELSLDDAVREILIQEKEIVSDRKENWGEFDNMGQVNQGIQLIAKTGVQFTLDGLNGLMQYLMPVMNGTRLWAKHGHSPDEIFQEMRKNDPDYGKNITLVPGSSMAAKQMAEGREELEKMGAHVDLDYGAETMPYVEFPRGINGPMVQKTKKIYPNDPCPCGSGKKYKFCHGRKK